MQNFSSQSFLTGNDVRQYKQTHLDLKHKTSFEAFETSDPAFYHFSRIMLGHLPISLVEELPPDQLVSLHRSLFSVLSERKTKRYHVTASAGSALCDEMENSSVIILVTDDRPFLFDSVREYFIRKDVDAKFIVHPIISVKRDSRGAVQGVTESVIGTENESFMIIFLEHTDDITLMEYGRELDAVYKEVTAAVDDFTKMTGLLKQMSERFRWDNGEVAEFIDWLNDGNFIVQGVRVVSYTPGGGDEKNEELGVFSVRKDLAEKLPAEKLIESGACRFMKGHPVQVSKMVAQSKMKRSNTFDRITFHEEGDNTCRLVTVVGLFTKDGIRTPPRNISIIRGKIKSILDHFNFVHGSHDFKWIRDIIDTFPKTEIFSFEKDKLVEILELILSMQGKEQFRLFISSFPTENDVYVLTGIPAEKFSSELVQEMSDFFEELFDASLLKAAIREDDHGYFFIHHQLHAKKEIVPDKAIEEKVKARLIKLLRDWQDRLQEELVAAFGQTAGNRLFVRYHDKFSDNYRTKCSPAEAALDIRHLEEMSSGVNSALYTTDDKLVLKVYSSRKILLTELMPIIDFTDLKVHEEDLYHLNVNDGVYISDIYLADIDDPAGFADACQSLLPEMLIAILTGVSENDRLNSLVISESLNVRQIDILRGLRGYTEQIAVSIRRLTLNTALTNNHGVAKLLVNYFEEKFDPSISNRNIENASAAVLEAIEAVESVQEDKVLRYFHKVITATLRTNHFMEPKRNWFSFKIASSELDILPQPKPMFEIFVHSADMSGIHLRGGMVARGGLRFSDRPDDFRTEVLGLMKTQMVKNAVIVPVGSKGGFVVKRRLADRDADRANVIEQYKTFIRGLLDITDNYHGLDITHPDGVVRYDEPDPYLVVAADKGTATFSDIANSVSIEYGFWLGDAFASGSSTGYDHKKVGITAKGAWECVKRHFREIGKNIQEEPFTVIGIGDMSGDVFGNGMLLSRKIKLLAAFNHMHIFVDPDPDPESSYIERERLFTTQGTTWRDYDTKLISKGGGVFDRSAKKIPLNDDLKAMFSTDADAVTGDEMVKLILKTPAELLWNGGIGTYVRDESETDLDVGDTANDIVRITAAELAVQVVGEGGNLGMTQKARISFARRGGRVNTDAIDNSAGVDMSDHEVNLKILCDQLVAAGTLADVSERNRLIEELTGAVTDLVLADNYAQSMTLSTDQIRFDGGRIGFEESVRFLEDAGILNAELEQIGFVGEDRPATRPELSVLLAYVKIFLYDLVREVVDVDDPLVQAEYEHYYPTRIITEHHDAVYQHRLVREIAATSIVNKVVNQAGMTTFIELHKMTNTDFPTLLITYLYADSLLSTASLRHAIAAADNKASSRVQYNALIEIEKTLKVAVPWLVNDRKRAMIDRHRELFNNVLSTVARRITGPLRQTADELALEFITGGLPEDVARTVVDIRYQKAAFDIFETVVSLGLDPEVAIERYYAIGDLIHVTDVSRGIKDVKIRTEWERINRENLLSRVKLLQQKLAASYTLGGDEWLERLHTTEQGFFENYAEFILSIQEGRIDSLVPYNVVIDSFARIAERAEVTR